MYTDKLCPPSMIVSSSSKVSIILPFPPAGTCICAGYHERLASNSTTNSTRSIVLKRSIIIIGWFILNWSYLYPAIHTLLVREEPWLTGEAYVVRSSPSSVVRGSCSIAVIYLFGTLDIGAVLSSPDSVCRFQFTYTYNYVLALYPILVLHSGCIIVKHHRY